jgi:predicted phage baseplate assembly protein
MPLPTPSLDDRKFQDLVDEAKRLIPRFCPEWTDHNVSDPGVALIELFAWMTELLLFRVNQVPDRMYVKFLNFLGLQLEPARPAHTMVTFYLRKPLTQPTDSDIPIPGDLEVSTLRTEEEPPIVFTTEEERVVHPPVVGGVYIGRQGEEDATPLDLERLNLLGEKEPRSFFPSKPSPGDIFTLVFERDMTHHVVALVARCKTEGGATGINPKNPPWIWEVSQDGTDNWAVCEVDDTTGGLSYDGEVVLHLPAVKPATHYERQGYWLRCRSLPGSPPTGEYKDAPQLTGLRIETRGGAAHARNAMIVTDEVLGRSDGRHGQTFRLQHTPLLPLDPEHDILIVEPPNERPQRWTFVPNFAESRDSDHVFTVDYREGTLSLGPALLQSDGKVYQYGAAPPANSQLIMSRYQYGGGSAGNVPNGTLRVLRSSLPFIGRVENRKDAAEGYDAETPDEAMIKMPSYLRTRTRAVTADDYEYWARTVPGVARACCLHPGEQPPPPGEARRPRPGHVELIILPRTDTPYARLAPGDLPLTNELRNAVLEELRHLRPLGILLEARGPRLIPVAVTVRLRLSERADQRQENEVRRYVSDALARYLNPYVGGPQGKGWPFGRSLYASELHGLLHRVEAVEFVEDITIVEAGGTTPGNRVDVPPGGLICSAEHRVEFSKQRG